MQMDELWTADAVANYLAVSKHTLANWRSLGQGPAHLKVGGKLVRYRADVVKAWATGTEVAA